MKIKKIFPLIATISVIFIVLYIILASKPLSKEYTFTPEWIINVNDPEITQLTEEKKLLNFKVNQSIGYFTEDGEITLYKSFPSKAAISNDYYALYNTEAKNIPFYGTDGNQKGIIKGSGYPFFNNDRLYLFLPGGSSFSTCDSNGNIKWTYESTIPITAFSSNQNYTVSGYADGSIKVFDNNDGNMEMNFAPGGSDYSILYGLDISPDGQYVASISGLEKQRFVLAHKEDNQPKIIFHHFLDSDLTRRTFVKFSSDGQRVFYNYQDNLGIYDLSQNKSFIIPIDKKILAIEEMDDLYFLLGKSDSEYTVYIIEKTNILTGSFSFEAESAFIRANNHNLFVGKDATISKIVISKE